jgi:hypothetical protein
MIPASREKFLNARQSLMNKVKGKGYATVMLGGILLGSGMTLAGTVSKQTNKMVAFDFRGVWSYYITNLNENAMACLKLWSS